MFSGCKSLIDVPLLKTSKGTTFSSMFQNCQALTSIPQLDTSNVASFNNTFYYCTSLTDIPLLDLGKCVDARNIVYRCSKLTNIGGFKDYGKAFTQKSNNYSNYTLNIRDIDSTTITHDSLMNIINNLYDLNLTYDVANGGTLYTQTLQLGVTYKAMLTSDELSIATNKGWVVS
jgi:surface protein